MKSPLYQPLSAELNVPYAPEDSTKLLENPPRFTWMPARLDEDCYVMQVSDSPEFTEAHTETFGPIPYNLFTPDHAFAPGRYYWRYALLEGAGSDLTAGYSEWSKVRSFTVTDNLPETPLPSREARYAEAAESHPRLWLQAGEVGRFRARVRADATGTGWDEFYAKSVQPWAEKPPILEPKPYPDNKRVAKLWRRMYMDCQETLYAIRHLSVAGVILEDAGLLAKAKAWLMHAAGWDTEGTTSRDYNDEAAFRIAGALAWGYDWLYNELTEEERATVRRSLLRRTRQVAFHVIERSQIHQVPYDSHAVRSLSSVLTPCCIALLGEEPEAREWLDYTVEYFSGLYTPWGGENGGWAEGAMYWTTGMAFVTEAMNLLKNYIGLDFYKRPFFTRTGDFPLYTFSPDTIRASFCDCSNLGEPPSLKTGFNIRQFAGVTGNGLYQWYYEQVKERDTDADSKFYNYGWWDFRFDEMMYRHDYPAIAAEAPTDIEPVKWFRDVGWVAMHSRMDDPDEHIMLLAKSSRYGSISHSHGDQNSFLLHAYGEPLAIESGYYGAFGSTIHLNWRKQTRSKNNILIDGKGQFSGNDKTKNIAASGTVLEAEWRDGYGYMRADATPAYREEAPYLNRYEREVFFVGGSYFVIVDHIDLAQPGKVDWLFHTLNKMTLKKQGFAVNGTKADMDVRFVYSSSGELELVQDDLFAGVDPAELDGLANHWHLTASTRKALSHRIVSLLVPMKKSSPKYVSTFMDDQDHGVHLYFTENGVTRKIEVSKVYRR